MVQVLPVLLTLAQGASLVLAQNLNLWAQCGGIGFTGQGECTTGAICSTYNPYYAQCVPGTPTTTTPTSTSSSCRSGTPTTTCLSFRDCCTAASICTRLCPGTTTSFPIPAARSCSCTTTTTPHITPCRSGVTSATTCISYEGLPCCQGITQTDCKTYCADMTPPPFTRLAYTCSCRSSSTTTTPTTTPPPSCTTTSTCTKYESYPCCQSVFHTACKNYCVGEPAPTISLPTTTCWACGTSTSTSSCTATTSACTGYVGIPCCQGLDQTACRTYCVGATATGVSFLRIACGCTSPTTPTSTSTTTTTTTSPCALVSTCTKYTSFPCCQGVTHTACKTYCSGQPRPTISVSLPGPCRCTTPSSSPYCATTTSTCKGYVGLPCCQGLDQTACRDYCVGQTAPPISLYAIGCSCPTTTAVPTRTAAPAKRELDMNRLQRRQEDYQCPMVTYYTTYPLCCGNYGTETGSVCRGSPRTKIPVPLVKCAPTCPSSTTCPLSTYTTEYPLCCGASGTATGSVCSGSRRTRIPTPVVRCAQCTTGGVTFATAIVTRIDTIEVRT